MFRWEYDGGGNVGSTYKWLPTTAEEPEHDSERKPAKERVSKEHETDLSSGESSDK